MYLQACFTRFILDPLIEPLLSINRQRRFIALVERVFSIEKTFSSPNNWDTEYFIRGTKDDMFQDFLALAFNLRWLNINKINYFIYIILYILYILFIQLYKEN
jgi:hypothetical protein